jgi:Fe-S cluster biogenesis protein NfuA
MSDKITIRERVINALERIRPYLQSDGGDISLVDITEDNTVKVKLQGACYGCPYSIQTLKAGVEQALLKEVPEIKKVVAVD